MGYRPEDQSIEGPLRKILEGIKEFHSAAGKRVESGEWKEDHLDELDDIDCDLLSMRRRILKLANENW
jgi:hypothetical protein